MSAHYRLSIIVLLGLLVSGQAIANPFGPDNLTPQQYQEKLTKEILEEKFKKELTEIDNNKHRQFIEKKLNAMRMRINNDNQAAKNLEKAGKIEEAKQLLKDTAVEIEIEMAILKPEMKKLGININLAVAQTPRQVLTGIVTAIATGVAIGAVDGYAYANFEKNLIDPKSTLTRCATGSGFGLARFAAVDSVVNSLQIGQIPVNQKLTHWVAWLTDWATYLCCKATKA